MLQSKIQHYQEKNVQKEQLVEVQAKEVWVSINDQLPQEVLFLGMENLQLIYSSFERPEVEMQIKFAFDKARVDSMINYYFHNVRLKELHSDRRKGKALLPEVRHQRIQRAKTPLPGDICSSHQNLH